MKTALLECASMSICLMLFATISSAQATQPIVIGWSGPLTGNCAVVGVDSLAAAQLAIDAANRAGGVHGRPLKLIAEDDAYIVTRAVSAYKKLVHQDGARLVIANTYGGVFATARDALRDGAIVIDPLDCNEDLAALPGNTFCLATRTESISAAIGAHIIQAHDRAVLLLVEESDGWMQLVAGNTRRLLEQAGIELLVEAYPASAASYRASLIKAKGAGATAVVLLGNDQMGAAPKEMLELGFPARIYGVGSIMSPGFRSLAGDTLEGAYVSSWQAPRGAAYYEFLARFKAQTGREPALELATLPSYDAAELLVQCLRESGRDAEQDSAARIRECLLQKRDFAGLTGKISFDPDGAVRSIHEKLYRLKNGRLSPIESRS